MLTRLGWERPPPLADNVLEFAVARRPAVARYLELRAVAAVHAGRCETAADAFIELLTFGIEREDGPALVQKCRGGRRRPTAAAPRQDRR